MPLEQIQQRPSVELIIHLEGKVASKHGATYRLSRSESKEFQLTQQTGKSQYAHWVLLAPFMNMPAL